MDMKSFEQFQALQLKRNPRARRGLLDSLYAEMINGRIDTFDAELIEKIAGMMYNAGFSNHVAKLLLHPSYSTTFPIIGQRVEGIGTHFAGAAAGFDTLSLGDRVVNSGPDWSVSEPVSYCVVPTGSRRLGDIIRTMPKGVAPLCAFFPKED